MDEWPRTLGPTSGQSSIRSSSSSSSQQERSVDQPSKIDPSIKCAIANDAVLATFAYFVFCLACSVVGCWCCCCCCASIFWFSLSTHTPLVGLLGSWIKRIRFGGAQLKQNVFTRFTEKYIFYSINFSFLRKQFCDLIQFVGKPSSGTGSASRSNSLSVI